MYDAIVVGARCAGSPTAMLLARKGYRVLLVDRARFPSDIFRSHFVRYPAVRKLHAWGLLERVLATGCPPVQTYVVDLGDLPLAGTPPTLDSLPGELAPRRYVLDTLLTRAAVEAGAELREGFSVRELVWEDGRVVGIRGRAGGAMVEERARLVIGADGQHSFVARAVNAPYTAYVPARTFAYFTYWSDLPLRGLEACFRDGRAVICFPTNDDLSLVAYQAPHGEFAAARADIEGAYLRTLESAPWLLERVRAARRAERYQGTADLPNFMRKPYGPGWALVGDAGYHKDPLPAHGISDAFRDAELLAEAVDDGLAGRLPPGVSGAEPPSRGGWGTARVPQLEHALARYEERRDEAARPLLDETVRQTEFAPPAAQMTWLRRAIQGDPEACDKFYGLGIGTVTFDELMQLDCVRRAMAETGPAP
jgi:2-polyprenyl-6-methoxyphenol hydroxylase-like FAD-dependent oxidoreductase